MAQAATLALDSGALIQAEKDPRVEALIRRFVAEGAFLIIPAPALAECVRGTARDATINRIVKMVGFVATTTEAIAREAGARLGRRHATIDALVVATAEANGANAILTSDPEDIRHFASAHVNVIAL